MPDVFTIRPGELTLNDLKSILQHKMTIRLDSSSSEVIKSSEDTVISVIVW